MYWIIIIIEIIINSYACFFCLSRLILIKYFLYYTYELVCFFLLHNYYSLNNLDNKPTKYTKILIQK